MVETLVYASSRLGSSDSCTWEIVQEFASRAATPGPDLSQTARKADSYPAQRRRDSQSMQGDAFEDQWDHHGRVKYHLKLSGSIAG